ncbi:MAG: hypothetical protein ACFCUU_19330 [Cyclobacteriaceae bacterium]
MTLNQIGWFVGTRTMADWDYTEETKVKRQTSKSAQSNERAGF